MSTTTNAIADTYYAPGGRLFQVVATAGQTGNTHFALLTTEPPGGGPPLHLQTRHDELFFVIEGKIRFWLDGRVIDCTAGGSAFAPRGVPHCFKNCSGKQARVLAFFTPGDIQGFFDYGKALANGSAPTGEMLMEKMAALGPLYGVELLGPSPL